MLQKVKKTKTPEQALTSLMRLCAKAERSSGDALRFMRGWGVADADARRVLKRLEAERFVDDRRYAEAFVREKMNLSGWGRYKIVSALRCKGIEDDIVAEAMARTEDTDMHERLMSILRRRVKSMRNLTPFQMRARLMRYAISAGYDFDTARSCVDSCVGECPTDEF